MAKGTLRVRIVGDASHLQKTLGKAGSNLTRFAKVGILGAAGAIAGGVAMSIKSFADFDQAMTNSTAIMTGLTDAMRSEMATAAREIGKTTKFGATEAAQAFEYLALAGLDAEQSIAALPQVAAFAQAGNFDLALATDLATDAQAALGLASKDATENLENLTRITDVLVKGSTVANASTEQFAESLTQKAGVALRQLNKDVEEGIAVLSVYANQGVKGSEAGVQLNAVLEGLTRTARLNSKEYKKLGVEVFDSSGEMRNMADIVGDLESAFDGLSTEQQLAALASLGLTRQARDGTIALVGNAEAIRQYESDLRSAAGFTEGVADKQMDTFWAKLGLVKDQLLDVALSVGQSLMPALEGFVDWLQAKLPAVTGFFERIGERFSAVGATVGEVSGTAGADLEALGRKLADEADTTDAHLRAMGQDFLEFNGVVGTSTEEAGDFMAAMGEAWQDVWNNDIQPWLMNTVVPWFRDEFLPAAGQAMMDAGAAAGKAFLDGLWSNIRNLPGFIRDALGGADAIGGKGLGGFQMPNLNPFSSRSVPRASGGVGTIRPMAHGGILKARPGGHVVRAAEAGVDEAFVPLTPQGMAAAGLGGGNTYITVHGTVLAERELLDLVDRGRARDFARNGR